MVNLTPGNSYLGKGFNGFGAFDASATENMLSFFDTSVGSGRMWEDPYSGNTYELPENVNVLPVSESSLGYQSFRTRSDVSEFFSLKAGVAVDYLAFSGAFTADFQQIEKSVSDNQFGMGYACATGFELSLNKPVAEFLSETVLNDPDYKNMPDTFTEETRYLFFQFFERYGTHFVRSVQMGGRLSYSLSIAKSFNFSETQFKANLEAEYDAVWQAKANAETKWKQLSKVWVDNRQVSIHAIGGDYNILQNLGKPNFGQNFHSSYESWLKSLNTQPGPMGFTLMGVENLFSGDKYNAVKQASIAYTQAHLYMNVQNAVGNWPSGNASIILNGQSLSTPPQDPGITFIVLDRSVLQPIFQVDFPLPSVNQSKWPEYNLVQENIQGYEGRSDVIIAMMWWGVNSAPYDPSYSGGLFPTEPVYSFLRACGAGAGLDQWASCSTSSTKSWVSYAIVGVPGWETGQALECFAAVPLNFPFEGPQFPGLTLQAFFKPEYIGQLFQYTPC